MSPEGSRPLYVAAPRLCNHIGPMSWSLCSQLEGVGSCSPFRGLFTKRPLVPAAAAAGCMRLLGPEAQRRPSQHWRAHVEVGLRLGRLGLSEAV